MTREQARKAAEIMLAYADGKDIEIAYNYKYQACPTPSFN